uniref:Uncharacterized protein n=1 Tax=Brassica campestris TaxID=3711 RepID=A0A3P6B1L0_BRACM|nr:unnamed protein product [Brassica rapa]
MTKVVTAGIGQCVKEIKLLWDRMEAMEKISVNGDKRERENTEPGGMTEQSVIILDKTKATKSDLKKEEGRRDKKKMLLWNCAVKRVNERGSLLRHRNLLFREKAQLNR